MVPDTRATAATLDLRGRRLNGGSAVRFSNQFRQINPLRNSFIAPKPPLVNESTVLESYVDTTLASSNGDRTQQSGVVEKFRIATPVRDAERIQNSQLPDIADEDESINLDQSRLSIFVIRSQASSEGKMSEVSNWSTASSWPDLEKELLATIRKARDELSKTVSERRKEYKILAENGWTEESECDRSNFDDNIDMLISQTATFVKETVDMIITAGCTDEKKISTASDKIDAVRKKVFAAVEKMPPVSDNGDLEAKAASEKTLEHRRHMLSEISAQVIIKIKDPQTQDLQEQLGLGAEAGHVPAPVEGRTTRSTTNVLRKAADGVGQLVGAIQSSPHSPFNRKSGKTPTRLTSTPNDDIAATATVVGKPPAAPQKNGQERTESWVEGHGPPERAPAPTPLPTATGYDGGLQAALDQAQSDLATSKQEHAAEKTGVREEEEIRKKREEAQKAATKEKEEKKKSRKAAAKEREAAAKEKEAAAKREKEGTAKKKEEEEEAQKNREAEAKRKEEEAAAIAARDQEEAKKATEKAEKSRQEAERLKKEKEALQERGRRELAETLAALKASREETEMTARRRANLAAQNAAPLATPAAFPSPTRSREAADATLQGSIDRVVTETKWDADVANQFAVRATEIYNNHQTDVSIADAVGFAKVDTVRELEKESWEIVKGKNARSHKRSPAKSADASTCSDEPMVTGFKSAEQVNKELLARSRLKEFRPSKRFGEGSFLGYQEARREFDRATSMDGLQAEDRWAEVKFYFEGIALKLAGVRATGETAEAALKRAFERMDRYFGARKPSPRESLQPLIDAGPIKEDDTNAHIFLALALEREIHEAKAQGKGSAPGYDQDHLIADVVNGTVPHLGDRFWQKVQDSGIEQEGKFNLLIAEIMKYAEVLRMRPNFGRGGKGGAGGKGGGHGGNGNGSNGGGSNSNGGANGGANGSGASGGAGGGSNGGGNNGTGAGSNNNSNGNAGGNNNNNTGARNGKNQNDNGSRRSRKRNNSNRSANGDDNNNNNNNNNDARRESPAQCCGGNHGPNNNCNGATSKATQAPQPVSALPAYVGLPLNYAETIQFAPPRVQEGPCPFCGGPHRLLNCVTITDEKYDGRKRRALFKEKNMCYNCGECGHQKWQCMKEPARCGTCGLTGHHTLLHFDDQPGHQTGTTLGDHFPRRRNAPKATPSTTSGNARRAPQKSTNGEAAKAPMPASGEEGATAAAATAPPNNDENSMVGGVKLGNVIPISGAPLSLIDVNLPAESARTDC